MFRKLICIISFVAALGMGLSIPARAADPDLAAYWNFDEGSGNTAFDSTGNGNDGTFVGDPQWVAGQFGGALEFDGDDYVNCGNGPSLQIQDEITMAFWFQVEAFQNTWEGFLAKGDDSYRASRGGGTGNATHMGISGTSVGGGNGWFNGTVIVTGGDWHHFAGTYDGTAGRIYIDGVLDVESPGTGQINISSYDLYIGENAQQTGRFFHGLLDDVRIYSRALSEDEIQGVMAGGGAEFPFASGPNPEDSALLEQTWTTLGWRAGDFAASHDVYLSDNFEDVNSGAEAAFQGNKTLTDTTLIIGFMGFPFPEGLMPGSTYYWRVDEVNDSEPNSPWIGPVWSFSIPPKTAYNPVPADGGKFVDLDPTLSWTAGFGAQLHTVYFGDDFDTVANATGGAQQGDATFSPGVLEPDKTYYWRVDEFEAPVTHTGEVWSFTTAGEGGGIKGEYFTHDGGTPHNPPELAFGTPVLTRMDETVDFQFGSGSPDASIPDDDYAARWTGEVEAPFTETYTFYTTTDDGVILWVDGQEILRNWTDHGSTEDRGEIDLVGGRTYSIEMWWYERGGGAIAELRWSSPRIAKQIIPQAALSPPIRASRPSPPDGAEGTRLQPILEWNPGDFAASHEVYLGTDEQAVADATKASPEFKATKSLGEESFDPGKLEWATQYFWRVDEVNAANPDSPWVGNVWTFTTGDFITVDNFEQYTDDDAANEAIWQHWIDGFGVATNGSQAGYTLPPYAEQTIVHSGSQSMPLQYNNTGGATNSEVELTLDSGPRDWTQEQVSQLMIWFQGRPASTGSFVQAGGTITMTGSGGDIWGNSDEFQFAYQTLTGAGTIVARVNSIGDTHAWAKAGVMIRETLEPGSKNAYVAVTPGNGVSFQWRMDTDAASSNSAEGDITAPHWVKLERDLAGNFTASHSTDGNNWQMVGAFENIQMSGTAFVGLAVTSHDAAQTTEAVFTNVTTTGDVTGMWQNQDIGIASNAAEPMYVKVSDATGTPAVVANPDPDAANVEEWTPWPIPLSEFSDQGINLSNVDKIAIGLGSGSGTAGPGGSGIVFIDDIRLRRSEP